MPQVIVKNILTSYNTYGNGPVILWLHGWGSSKETFLTVISQIKSYKHISLDLPGFGASEPPQNAWGLEDYAVFVSEFLHKLDIVTYAVVGHSNGGSVAITLLAGNFVEPEKLVLLASAGIRNLSDQKAKRKLSLVTAKIGKLVAKPLPKSAQKKLRNKLYETIGSDRLLDVAMDETFRKTTAEDVLDKSSYIKIPTLLIYGKNDDATPVRFGELYADRIKKSTLVVVESDHYVHINAKEKVVSMLSNFLVGKSNK